MSRKRCRRKVYALVNPIELAIDGARVTDAAHLNKLRTVELSAIAAFAENRAQPSDWRDIADMLNIAETLARSGVGPEVLEACTAVQAVLMKVKTRVERFGKMEMLPAEVRQVSELYEWHDTQRISIGRAEYERAIVKTGNRIRGGHPDVKVLV